MPVRRGRGHRHGGELQGTSGQRLEGRRGAPSSPATARSQKRQRRARPSHTSPHTCGLPDCETTCFRSLKPPSSWHIVMAAVGSRHIPALRPPPCPGQPLRLSFHLEALQARQTATCGCPRDPGWRTPLPVLFLCLSCLPLVRRQTPTHPYGPDQRSGAVMVSEYRSPSG